MNRMKKSKWILVPFLAVAILIPAACGKSAVDQENGGGETSVRVNVEEEASGDTVQGMETMENESGDEIVLHREVPYWNYRPIEPTREEPNYTSEEWENGKCLNIYVMISDMEGQEIGGQQVGGQQIPEIEDELNHRLYMAGHDFYIQFLGPTDAEMYGEDWQGGQTSDELVRQKRQNGIMIDIWVTADYVSAVQNGEVLELTNFLRSGEGSSLYANFDDCVWEQLLDSEGRIYGVPMNPVATCRTVYSYTPQLMEQLSIDMSSFEGNPKELEDLFPVLLQRGILPMELDFLGDDDMMMLSLFGLENYGGIIAVRHDGSDWEAVDLWEQEEAIEFYTQLGEWKEKGYLGYGMGLQQSFQSNGMEISSEIDDSRYSYILFRLEERETNSWNHVVNASGEENGNTATKYIVPDCSAYSSYRWIQTWGAAVISAQTEHPQECMQFLQILFTDPEIRLLLYKGIEGYSYVWQDDVLMNASAYGFPIGLGLSQDLRFWPVGDWGANYAAEISDMNRGVSVGLGMTMPYDLPEDPDLSDKEAACRQIIEENSAVFMGYYGNETGRKLEEVHEQLIEAGYLELIEAVNAEHQNE